MAAKIALATMVRGPCCCPQLPLRFVHVQHQSRTDGAHRVQRFQRQVHLACRRQAQKWPGVMAMAVDGAEEAPTGAGGGGPRAPASFLSLEEAGLVEMSGLDMHERFLARLTISSLNLLRVVSEQENVPIEELNSGRICDWFLKDKAKREADLDSAVLKWDNGPGW